MDMSNGGGLPEGVRVWVRRVGKGEKFRTTVLA